MQSKFVSGALNILSTCMRIKKNETLLLICDPSSVKQSSYIKIAAAMLGNDVVIERIGDKVTREPPERISNLMKERDISIFCVEERKTLLLGHSNARRDACQHGARIGFLTQSLYPVPSSRDLMKIRARSHRIASKLAKAREVKITSRPSYELRLTLSRKRKPIVISSIIGKKGEWGAIPDYSEVAIAPLENRSHGSLIVDSVIGLGKQRGYLEIAFEKGRIISMTGDPFGRRLEEITSSDQGSAVLCELGAGMNHLRRKVIGEFDDKKKLGSLHIGLGDNHTIGGKNISKTHVDLLVEKPEIELDGKPLDLLQT